MSASLVKTEAMSDDLAMPPLTGGAAASANAAAGSAAAATAAPSDPSAGASPAASPAVVDANPVRDDYARTEEDKGIISFPVVYNDGLAEHMVALVGLKNIFSAQLPKMPKVRQTRTADGTLPTRAAGGTADTSWTGIAIVS